MRAVKAVDGAAAIVECPEPDSAGVLVEVASAGICSSDIHLLDWGVPVVLGHEMAGRLPDGTPVAVEPVDPCWKCPQCKEGAYNLCEKGPSMVLGVGRDGGMAERCTVPESSIIPLPAGLALGDACLIERGRIE